MKYNFVQIKSKVTNNINLNNKDILELFKLSAGNNIIIKEQNEKESSNQHLDIIYYKKYIKKNIGKMIYKTNKMIKE